MTNENNNDRLAVQSKDSRTTVESIEIRSDRSMTCYICYENIVATHKQFGLQSNCDHFFCFDCLSTWRRTSAVFDKDIGTRCPLCRARSAFIAPSWRCFNDADDKQSLIDAHKLYLKTVPCRNLLRYGYCSFGHRCYYNHNSPFSLSRSSSSTDDTPVSSDENQSAFFIFQWNPRRSLDENNNDDEQQEPPRRITFNSHRYRPY